MKHTALKTAEGKSKIKTAALILNGTYLPQQIDGGYVLCADGGYNLLKAAGLKCDAVIGDLDSASNIPPGVKLIVFDKDKGQTDGELAVLRLCAEGYARINIYGALGGRADQQAGNLALLAIAHSRGAAAVIYDENTEIHFIEGGGSLSLQCKKGDIISVVPYTDYIAFSDSYGLVYPLGGLTVERLSTLGISNSASGERVSISVKSGKAFVYRLNAAK